MAKKLKVDPELQKRAEQSVKETANLRDFAYHGEVDLGKTWAITISVHRDSGLLDQSNYAVIKKDMEERFPNDVSDERFNHWAVGWVDHLLVRMLDGKGNVTPAGIAILEWQDRLSDYPVADESDYSERETEATIENIMSEGRIDRKMAEEVYGWLWDHNERALENRDDQGGYPSEEAIEAALEGLGYVWDEETEEWKEPEEENPSQLRLFGKGEESKKGFEKKYPLLQQHLKEGNIFIDKREYVGKASDGREVLIGTVGMEDSLEDYLKHFPGPDLW